jgi:spoIIIJ-associated protein
LTISVTPTLGRGEATAFGGEIGDVGPDRFRPTRLERGAIVAKTAQAQDAAGGAESGGSASAEELLVREGDIAADYIERLLDLLDYDGDLDIDVEAGRAVLSVEGGGDLGRLVGEKGAGLEALQELTRLAVQQSTGTRSRLMLDIAGWRSSRRVELSELGKQTADDVVNTGQPVRLKPMTPFERKVVHDAVAQVKGVFSESEGEEPRRRVVVFPK